MSTVLLNRVKQFLKALETLQEATLGLFEQKRRAVTAADHDDMLRLADVEAELSQRMKAALGARREILLEARKSGHAADSIRELVTSIAGDERDALGVRIEASRQRSERIRRESWVQWVISQRANTYYNELLELIAYSGKKAPVYSDRPGAPMGGGTILDASA